MNIIRIIDADGIFLRDEFIENIKEGERFIEGGVPQGLITPKWNGSAWVEGATVTKLAELNTQRLAFTLSETNRTNIESFLKTAVDENRLYVALVTPTLTQQTKQIKALTRQNNKLIRLMLNLLDPVE